MKKALFNLPVLTCAVLSLGATLVISAWVFDARSAGPTLLLEPSPVPQFNVTDHTGQTLTRDDMLGRVWVCDFFLTECTYICPMLGATMAELSAKLSEDPAFDEVALVSFSVNPEHDTIEVIRAYRELNMPHWSDGDADQRARLDSRWVHTRADDNATIWSIANDGFKLYTGPSQGDPTTPVAHSAKLVLIDRSGQIRGYYDGLTDEDKPALLADIRRLVEDAD